MKVLHCLAQLPMKTGSGVYFTTLVEGLLRKGHSNAVVYAVQKPFSRNLITEGLIADIPAENPIIEYPVAFLTESLPFPIAGMSDIMPYTSTRYSDMDDAMLKQWKAAFMSVLQQARAEYAPDVVIVHHLFIFASLVRIIYPDTKIIGISHGTDIRQLCRHPYFHHEYMQAGKLDRYCTVSPESVNTIHTLFSVPQEDIIILGGGFNPLIFNDAARHRFDGTFKLMYAGKIAESKGVFELAAALPLILKVFPNTELLLVGNADDEQQQRLYERAMQSPQLHIHNATTQAEMGALLKTMDIFILPSYYESLGLVAVEALACGMYTVTTEIEGLQMLLGNEVNTCGIIEYVPKPKLYDIDKIYEAEKPAFIQNLAAAIIRQMEKIAAGMDCYPAVAAAIQSHSWNSIIDRIEKLCYEVLEDSGLDIADI